MIRGRTFGVFQALVIAALGIAAATLAAMAHLSS